jgi:hypothetical protein
MVCEWLACRTAETPIREIAGPARDLGIAARRARRRRLVLAAAATALLLGPVAYHRLVFRRGQKESLVQAACAPSASSSSANVPLSS